MALHFPGPGARPASLCLFPRPYSFFDTPSDGVLDCVQETDQLGFVFFTPLNSCLDPANIKVFFSSPSYFSLWGCCVFVFASNRLVWTLPTISARPWLLSLLTYMPTCLILFFFSFFGSFSFAENCPPVFVDSIPQNVRPV